MKKFASILVATFALSTIAAMPAFAEKPSPDKNPAEVKDAPAESTNLKGKITKIDGKNVTLKEGSFTVDETTVVVKDGQTATIKDLAKGQHITAIVKNGVATRIEIHGKNAKHTAK